MALDATVGGSSSNSYVTVLEADNYFLTSYNRPLWSSANNSTKETLLIEATRLLDVLVTWKGYVTTDTQALKWPRQYVPNYNAKYTGINEVTDNSNFTVYIADNIIPKDIKTATFELAYSVINGNGFDNSENDLSKVKVGPIEVDFSSTIKPDGFPRFVKTLIQPYGEYNSESSNSVFTATLVRT